ncbi:MAG: response regulator [Polyangiaceae bacterium]
MSTLLVVDDSPTVRKLVEISFTGRPWQLQFASSGARGIEAALSWNPEVVLLDYLLPDMNGADVCREITRAGLDCGVILMTAKEGLRAELSGFPCVVGHLAKPFTVNLIVEATARALATRKLAVGAGGAARPQATRPHGVEGGLSVAPASATLAVGSASGARRVDHLFGLLDALDVIARRHATGVLTVSGTRGRWRFIAADGGVRAVTNENALADLDALGARHAETLDARAHAAMNPPAFLQLGAMSTYAVTDPFKRIAAAAIVDALHHPHPELAWIAELPTSVRPWLPSSALSHPYLKLVGLRALPELATSAPPPLFVRQRNAKAAVPAADLTSAERAILTLTAKPRTALEVAAQLGQDPSTVSTVLRRLVALELLVRAESPSTRASTAVVIEPSAATREALVGFLHRVPGVTTVLGLHGDESTAEQVASHSPHIVVVNTDSIPELASWVERLRASCPDVLIVGIAQFGASAERADCDGTFVKPVAEDELIDFIREA